jgi:hypothetical protein
MNELLTAPNMQPGRSLDYAEFLNDLSMILIEDYGNRINYYVMTCIEYFKSQWSTIKSNAAAFVGFLLGNLPVEKRKGTNINPGLISKGLLPLKCVTGTNCMSALINLLKEKDPKVRKACADSMQYLWSY